MDKHTAASSCPDAQINPQTGRPVVCDIMLQHVTESIDRLEKSIHARFDHLEQKVENGLTTRMKLAEDKLIANENKLDMHHKVFVAGIGVILLAAMTTGGWAILHAIKAHP